MKQIELTQGQFAIVDNDMYVELNQYKWFAQYSKSNNSFYAMRNGKVKNGKRPVVIMHRIIINALKEMQVDHKNHNTLDNRKCNLRQCTHSENQHNHSLHKKKMLSKYKGVSWKKENKKWQAGITLNRKQIYLGLFDSDIDAAVAYNKKAKELFGEFALLNVGV